jgi:uncharacterized protein (DUF2235 family)
MGRNIILCSDGTGNTFKSQTNVRRIVECISVEDKDNQIVVYDQGVGTPEGQSKEFDEYFRRVGQPRNLFSLVSHPMPLPEALWHLALGLTIGVGIKENVKQLYTTLAELYEPSDHVFLFGFSRGAFTVRALAGLLYRCHLASSRAEAEARFDQAWKLFEPLDSPAAALEFRKTQRQCSIHFMGVWDTVKSYGVLDPVMLPHLRHNPSVSHVRHALAIHEHRAFFQHTTWGLLDSDEKGAMIRLREYMSQGDLDLLEEQRNNIQEVWFDGFHSDIGGGMGHTTATIALRWMLGEVASISDPLRLSKDGKNLLGDPDPTPDRNESDNAFYSVLEQVPRKEIDNSGKWPEKHSPLPGETGKRDLDKSARRDGKVFLHETVRAQPPIKSKVERCPTKRLAATAQGPT